MNIKKLLCTSLLLGSIHLGYAAGPTPGQVVLDPDWTESEVPPPPRFNKDKLVPIDMPKYVSLKFGVDPATLAITPDGIVRYVMVATNVSGSINAMYEGIRCATGEVKTYARYASNGEWSTVAEPQWRELNSNQPSKHALALARQTDLIATVPECHTTQLRSGLHSFPLPVPAREITVSMLWHPRLHADAAHRWLRGCVREVCASEAQPSPTGKISSTPFPTGSRKNN